LISELLKQNWTCVLEETLFTFPLHQTHVRPAPGHHWYGFSLAHDIDTANLDLKVDLLHPEAMVYSPGPNGKLELGAVEYIVPTEPWDAAGNTHPPMLMGRHFHLNEKVCVYGLHAWIWKNNPSGIFEDWNPKVSCQ
jgi:hypothetical protein